MKKRHMAHHFHDETGNYGITTFFWDKLFGTFYDRSERPAKSPTVFNLGYTPEVAERWPWVARLSGGVAERSEEHTSELQSLMRISYAVFCLKKKNTTRINYKIETSHTQQREH